jgi:hypothetical protein
MVSLEEIIDEYDYTLSLKGVSKLSLLPGDILLMESLEYGSRLILVVKSKRTSTGQFISTRNNLLLNVFQLDLITLDMFKIVVNILYKNRVRCTYNNTPKILGAFLKHTSFRTLDMRKIDSLIALGLHK